MLDLPAPKLTLYPKETVVSEKFEAMVKLGIGNSRMKDFYDIWFLSRKFSFEGVTLAEAVRLTFQHRGTKFPDKIEIFGEPFIKEKTAICGQGRSDSLDVPPGRPYLLSCSEHGARLGRGSTGGRVGGSRNVSRRSGRNRHRLAEFICGAFVNRNLREQIPVRAKIPEAACVGFGARSQRLTRLVHSRIG